MTNQISEKYGNIAVILGGQWGDEGKGKLIDIMSGEYEIVARAAGGANAGHTVYVRDPVHEEETKKFIFHLMPSGMLYPNVIGVIGNGCVVHLPTLFDEIKFLKTNNIEVNGRLFISDRAHLVFEYHKIIDGLQEERKGKGQVGTTKRGIGPAYGDKMSRIGIRAGDLLDFERFEQKLRSNVATLQTMYNFDFNVEHEIEFYRSILETVKPMITDTGAMLNKANLEGKKILLEGANGTLLDIDHGTYPFCTSSNASIGGICTGTGLAPSKFTAVIGIMKAYMTRVGAGPFPTEQDNETGEMIREKGGEFGSTTGRPRRCGWFDAVASRYSADINGMTGINLTKLDVLDSLDTIKIGVSYKHNEKTLESFPYSAEILEQVEVDYIEMPGWKTDTSSAKKIDDLPPNAKAYVEKLEQLIGVSIDFVGVGQKRDEMAVK